MCIYPFEKKHNKLFENITVIGTLNRRGKRSHWKLIVRRNGKTLFNFVRKTLF